jgi:hypothetical protein
VKHATVAIALAWGVAAAAPAASLEFLDATSLAPVTQPAAPSAVRALTRADLAIVPGAAVIPPAVRMSELPEPEVFLMMLVGLCLIGYRASRHSDEKFE